MVKSVLVADSDPAQLRLLEETIERVGLHPKSVSTGEQALQILDSPEAGTISLVVLDLTGETDDGMLALSQMQSRPSMPPIIVQTAQNTTPTAIDAMRAGAVDFVVKPASQQRLEVSIRSALKIKALADEISRIKKSAEGTLTLNDLIVRDEAMERVVALGKRAATSTIPVLIEGEGGVGKEVIARAIHGESDRAGKPFITVNCSAIPEGEIATTIFGRATGSGESTGKFQDASEGTLFLDEIGELSLAAQEKLLAALQDGTIETSSAQNSANVNVRLVAATSRDMIQLVRDGKFREDLYYRLNVFPILVPRLRDRLSDVPELARHFLVRLAAEEGKRVSGIDAEAIRLLKSYAWPGNVRQLENAIFRAVVLSDGPELTVSDFPQIAAHVAGFEAPVPCEPAPIKVPGFTGPALLGAENLIPHTVEVNAGIGKNALGIPVVTDDGDIRPLDDIEADMIRLALGRYRGHMTEVAKRLKIGRSTLYRKMQEYGLEPRA